MFRYTPRQILLHWAVVALIAVQFLFNGAIGAAFRDWMDTGTKQMSLTILLSHVLPGVLVLIFTIWRLALRRSAPAAPHGNAPLDKLALAVHGLLYLLMLLVPVSGMVAWMGGVKAAAEAHEVMKTVLLLAIVLHVIGAVYHQFVLKDGLMKRMSLRG